MQASDRAYVLLCSSGRSGSNWLLDILNLSERTFPRNEPYGQWHGTAFSELKPAWEIVGADDGLLEARWDKVIERAAASRHSRDPNAVEHKRWVRAGAKRLGLDMLLRRHRMRRAASWLVPSIRGLEWRPPAWLVDRQELAVTLPIFKVNNAPGWAVWALRHRGGARVVHLVRHPGGMLNSWGQRYRDHQDPADHIRINRQRLRRVAEADPRWAERLGEIDRMSLDETELWYWRYANESIYLAGAGHERYLVVPFEQVTERPMQWARRAYVHCGLPWEERIERQVTAMSENSRQIARAWRERLSEQQIDLVERVLSGSALAELWREPSSLAAGS